MSDKKKSDIIIFPPSSGCELANWLLKLYDIPNNVISHTAPFFLISILLHGGKTYPFLEYQGKKLSGIREILPYLEDIAPEDKKLFPSPGKEYDEAMYIWDNLVLKGVDAAATKWAYSYLLPHKNLIQDSITKNVPCWEKLIVAIGYPLIAKLIGTKLGIAKNTPTDTVKIIRNVFDEMDQILSDGRRFLAGNKLTIADVGFASLAAPVTLEPLYGHGGLLPNVEDVPEEMKKVVEEMRERPTGKFISKIYQDFR